MPDLKCPCCGTPGVPGEGGKVVCSQCGGTYTFIAGEAKLTGVAEFDQLKKTVESQAAELDALKKQLGQGTPNGEKDGDSPAEVAELDDDEEDEESEFD